MIFQVRYRSVAAVFEYRYRASTTPKSLKYKLTASFQVAVKFINSLAKSLASARVLKLIGNIT